LAARRCKGSSDTPLPSPAEYPPIVPCKSSWNRPAGPQRGLNAAALGGHIADMIASGTKRPKTWPSQVIRVLRLAEGPRVELRRLGALQRRRPRMVADPWAIIPGSGNVKSTRVARQPTALAGEVALWSARSTT
jgi:hypothetical protein